MRNAKSIESRHSAFDIRHSPMKLSWAVRTDPGLRRSSNEDSYCTRADLGLFVVADGMGGHVAGEVASRLAVETIQNFIAETAGADKNRTWPFPFEPAISLEANRLKAAFRLANRQIANAMADSADLRGMATTASAVLAGRNTVCVGHVGDSRIYVLRKSTLQQITDDHSWVEEQVRAGTMTATAARQHPWRNVVTRALSGGSDPEIDILEISPGRGERYLLCSDGLSGVVTHETIARILGGTEGGLDGVCEQLVAAANEGGGPDNVTVLVLEVVDADAS
jgi:protein phosphatase